MCGRVRLSSDVSEIKLVFSIPRHRLTPNFPPSWNGAPTDLLPVVRYDRKAGERSLDHLRWGLIPRWAKDIKVGFAKINAKAEGIESRPALNWPSPAGEWLRSFAIVTTRPKRAVRGATQSDAGRTGDRDERPCNGR